MWVEERLRFAASMMINQRRGIRQGTHWRGTPQDSQPARELGPLERYFDDHTSGRGIWKWRHYLEIYDRHLRHFRGKPVHMVEIGVYGGGSLRMWRDYLGEQVTIYGVDVEPECRQYSDTNVEIFIGDQGDPRFWTEFKARVPKVDIVLDDGGHQLEQQIVTLEALLPHVRPGGVFICEDVESVSNPFYDYAVGLARNLNDTSQLQRLPDHGARLPPTSFQRSISAVHLYPFMVVIDKQRDLHLLESLRRGSEWPTFG